MKIREIGLIILVLLLVALVVVVVSAESNVTHYTGGVEVGTLFRTVPQTAISVTANNQTISPTGAYQPLAVVFPAKATSSITAGTAGDWLYLTNTMSNTITLTDTGTLKLGGNRTIGQYDSLLLVSNGTYWVEVSLTDN